MMRQVEWSLHEGCSLLSGVDPVARQLIQEMDARIAQNAKDGAVHPRTMGLMVVCIMTCAYYCEVALKTLQTSLNGGVAFAGHDLQELYEWAEKAYLEAYGDSLENDIRSEVDALYSKVPPHWRPPDIEGVLRYGPRNFEEWRYGFPENSSDSMANGVPHQLFAIASGIFSVCLKRNSELWGESGESYLVPNPDGGFLVVAIE